MGIVIRCSCGQEHDLTVTVCPTGTKSPDISRADSQTDDLAELRRAAAARGMMLVPKPSKSERAAYMREWRAKKCP
jgi:hypothetical protein